MGQSEKLLLGAGSNKFSQEEQLQRETIKETREGWPLLTVETEDWGWGLDLHGLLIFPSSLLQNMSVSVQFS
jgi:hypothetical protein